MTSTLKEKKMKDVRINNKANGRWSWMVLFLLVLAVTIMSNQSAINPTSARATDPVPLATNPSPSPPKVTPLGNQPSPTPLFNIFNLDTFEANLKAELQSKTVGYEYAIYENTVLKKAGAGGYAFIPGKPQSPDRRMTVMSMTKTITATGVMKAIEELNAQGKKVTIDSKIAPYLPSEWHLGPRVNELTFRHLLTHTGGLRPATGDPDSYLGLKQTILNGVNNDDFGTWHYRNANFCLFRIIIPYMIMSPAEVKNIEKLSWEERALTLGNTYVGYIKQHVLALAGLTDIDIVPTGPKPYVRYYKFGDNSAYASDPVDDTAVLRTGAGYWFMSAKEYATFLTALRNAKIVGWPYAKSMQDDNLGMYGVPSKYGTYWDHNGGFPPQANGSGAMADWMMFPNGVTAVILVNSSGGTTKPPQQIMRDAFDAAW
jgi:CubicO group peptidase (beta-lactamase class C family)